jgi:peptidoglycan/xylan/chitin deacetylase (PgdA/CDA1 family)
VSFIDSVEKYFRRIKMLSTALLLLFVCSILFILRKCSSQISSPGAISSYSPGGQYILLTFDNSPHPEITLKILEILKEKKARATFFIHGNRGSELKDILNRIIVSGHDIGINGWAGAPITKMSRDRLAMQLSQTSKMIKDATSYDAKFMRPPNGLTNAQLNEYIKYHNMSVVLWSLDSKDLTISDPKKIIEHITLKANPGDIVLFHDSRPIILEALPGIIDALNKKGYEFLTLSQISTFPDDKPHRRLQQNRVDS